MSTIEITMYAVWGALIILGVVIELVTWIQIGPATSIASVIAISVHAGTAGDPLWPEILAFVLVWIVTWPIIFYLMRNYSHRMRDRKDGIYGLIEKEAIVLKPNDGHNLGTLLIGAKKFRFDCEETVKKNDTVIILSITGNTMTVKKRWRK